MRLTTTLRAAGYALASQALMSTGCAPEEPSIGSASTVLLEGAGGARGEGALEGGAGLLVAFDPDGALVLVDVDEGAGAVVARRALSPSGDASAPFASAGPVDVVVDPGAQRAFVVARTDEEGASALFEVPLGPLAIGQPIPRATLVGEARAMPIAGGVVIASNEDGPRVRLLRDDGARTRGRALSEPRSWWSAERGARIEGVSVDPDEQPFWFALEVDEGGSVAVVDRRPLGERSADVRWVPGASVTTARGERRASATLVAHDPASGGIDLVDVDDGQTRAVAFRAATVEGATRWRGAVAFTTSGPDALVVVGPEGERVLALSEPVRSAAPFGRHDLMDVGDVLFVATRSRVIAVRDAGARLDVDGRFDGLSLRGPLARWAR